MFDHIKTRSARRTLHLVAHFHVDPVWWNTQAASIDQLDRSDWSASPRMGFQRSALDILRQHLDRAERDADYRFCVAELDYLEPFWFHHPHERDRLLRLVVDGRLDVVGATYNEPSTNLTSLELTRRNLQFGLAFQRDVLGAAAVVSWQLDVFGHDPSLPSVLADAGVTATVFARGPFGPWGPLLRGGFDSLRPSERRPIAAEFEWIAPDGRSVLAVNLVGHYSSGYELDRQDTFDDALAFIRRVDETLSPLAASTQTVVPIGTDLGPPVRWITDLARYDDTDGPMVVTSTPTRALDAVRQAVDESGFTLAPHSRDLNPIYTGKDVSFIDSKQAHRAAEHLLVEAETWATLAHVSCGAPYPFADIDDAWRLLVYGSHHDALTGTESDQVYIDLSAGWRHAHDLARSVRSRAVAALAAATDTGDPQAVTVIVHSSGFGHRRDVVQVMLGPNHLAPLGATGLRVSDGDGANVAFVVDHHEFGPDGTLDRAVLTMVVQVIGIGRTVVQVCAGDELPTWQPIAGGWIANAHHQLTVDPDQGGCITSWRDRHDTEIVHPGRVANEIVWYPEYTTHPEHGEGPWHLSPTGTSSGTGAHPARVQALRSPIGERLRIEGDIQHDDARRGRHTSELTLWADVDRVDGSVQIDDVDGADHLIRLRWPIGVPGATPVFDTAEAVIGRGPAFVDVDAAEHPWTLDNPANGWFGTSVTCRVDVQHAAATTAVAIAVAEIVIADRIDHPLARSLVVGLAATGVTATTTLHDADRAGCLGIDSNVPDIRLVVGVVGEPLVEAQLRRLGDVGRHAVLDRLATSPSTRAWIPASRSRREILVPGLDVRGDGELSTLVVVGRHRPGLEQEIGTLVRELSRSVVTVQVDDPLPPWAAGETPENRTVAVVNRGTPGSAVGADGCLHMSLQRASQGWPSGVWIDPPRRAVPDGSAFQLQHWTHRFDFALVARPGDWRSAGVARTALEYQRPLHAHVEPGHEGPLDSTQPRLSLGDDGVELRALLVARRSTAVTEVDLRVSETHGRTSQRTLETSLRIGARRAIDLRGQPVAERSGPFTATTLRLEVVPMLPVAPAVTPKVDGDPTPRFSRWWAQGRGPRTSTVGPLAVHLHRPGSEPAGQWSVTVTRVAGCLGFDDERHPLDVELRVDGPDGWFTSGVLAAVRLDPDEFSVVQLDGAAGSDHGHQVLRVTAAWTAHSGRSGRSFDEEVVSVSTRSPVLHFAGPPPHVDVAAGGSIDVVWLLTNDATTDLDAEVDIVSPWGSWDLLPASRVAVGLAPGVATPIAVTVEAPLAHRPGTWWWMARAVAGPNTAYSPTATLAVRPSDTPEPSPDVAEVSSSR
jgi:hypothetical protein